MYATLGPTRSIATYFLEEVAGGRYFNAMTMNLSDVIDLSDDVSHAVILYGNTKPDSCAANPEAAYAVNVVSIKTVVDWLNSVGITPVFTSTESVFDGEKGNYTEEDCPNPLHPYGLQKIEVEDYIEKNCNRYIIARLGRVFGSTPGDGTLLDQFVSSIHAKETIYCAFDQVFSPVYVADVVSGIINLINGDCSGVFHLCNPVAHSRLQILEQMIVSLRKHEEIEPDVIPCEINSLGLDARRPLNISMDPTKLINATGMEFITLENICDKMAAGIFQPPQQTNRPGVGTPRYPQLPPV